MGYDVPVRRNKDGNKLDVYVETIVKMHLETKPSYDNLRNLTDDKLSQLVLDIVALTEEPIIHKSTKENTYETTTARVHTKRTAILLLGGKYNSEYLPHDQDESNNARQQIYNDVQREVFDSENSKVYIDHIVKTFMDLDQNTDIISNKDILYDPEIYGIILNAIGLTEQQMEELIQQTSSKSQNRTLQYNIDESTMPQNDFEMWTNS